MEQRMYRWKVYTQALEVWPEVLRRLGEPVSMRRTEGGSIWEWQFQAQHEYEAAGEFLAAQRRAGCEMDLSGGLDQNVMEQCEDCRAAKKHAYSDATTPGFFYPFCMKHCPHERLNEDGICRACGADRRGI
jgi:hypothetical protein